MAFFNRVKNIFKGSVQEEFKRPLPPIVQTNVNPRDLWEIVGELGDGAFGKVEKAVSKSNPNKLAASKAIEVQDGESIEDFLVEIEILTTCIHTNIVALHACYYYEEKLHMMLELCSGGAVDGIMIELEKPLTEPQIAYVARYTNEALIFLHDKNVIHRDLKAGNILLTHDGVVKLADFGVSAMMKEKNEKRDTFIGTPYWMAPEVMMCETFKDKPYGTISDMWSFGITLIEMAQMEPPHSNVSPMRVIIKVQRADPPTLDNPAAWSKNFNNFLKLCLTKAPEDRKTAREMAAHPFLRDATDRKPILTLLAEVNAEIQEEVILDEDRGSINDSIADSEGQASEPCSWSCPSPAPHRPIPEVFKVPALPAASTSNDSKKRAAPPPPAPQNSAPTVSATATSLVIDTKPLARNEHSQKTPEDKVLSPRKEAIDILDDLNDALEEEPAYFDQPSSSSIHESPKSPQEPWMRAPESLPSSRSHSPLPIPDNNIKKVIEQARRETRSASLSPQLQRNSYAGRQVETNQSLHKQTVNINTDKNFARTRLDLNVNAKTTFPSADDVRQNVRAENMKPAALSERNLTASEEISTAVNLQLQPSAASSSAREVEHSHTQSNVAKIAATFSAMADSQPQPQPVKASSRSSSVTRHDPVPVQVKQPRENVVQRSDDHDDSTQTSYFDSQPVKKIPPPEPPVDYEQKQETKENKPPLTPPVISTETSPEDTPVLDNGVRHRTKENGTAAAPSENRIGGRRNPHRQTVTKKTRTYMVDGMQVTSTTLHVLGAKEDMQHRKQQLQDIRRLQREEARQKQELQAEGLQLAEQQERKFQQEKFVLNRQYENDMEALERKQKKEIEDAERMQEEEMKLAQKRLKVEQERDIRAFRERMKQEMKILKQELDMLPRAQRKEAIKVKREHAEHENNMKEADFIMQLQQSADATMGRMAQKHKERIAQMERQFLMQKHLVLRAKENSEWELEEKQMTEKYVLHRKLFKDEYFLLRSQMLARHQKEMTQVQKIHQEEEEELIRALTADRKKLPKMLRQEAKTRNQMFKESLRISMQPMTPVEIAEQLRRFEEKEMFRCKQALDEHDQKSAKKIASLKERHNSTIRELEELQNEKRKQLLEKERNTMQEHERKYFEMKEQWQADLAPRKLMLESRFQEELEAQERFYGIPLGGTLSQGTMSRFA